MIEHIIIIIIIIIISIKTLMSLKAHKSRSL